MVLWFWGFKVKIDQIQAKSVKTDLIPGLDDHTNFIPSGQNQYLLKNMNNSINNCKL